MRNGREVFVGPRYVGVTAALVRRGGRDSNGVPYGWSASIYTQDVNRAVAAMRDMETGVAYVNAPTIGAEGHPPSGDTTATGNGHRKLGMAAPDVFFAGTSIEVGISGRRQRAHIDTADL
jgi:aldehyde dehydrogenase (NAD+)